MALLAAALTFAVLSPPAGAAVSCDKRVIADWLEDGNIDGVYKLRCYEAAIDAMPKDLRDYSDATDAMERSLAAAVIAPQPPGGGGGAEPSPTAAPDVIASGASASLPLPLLLLAGVLLTLGAAAMVAQVWRRPGLGRRGASR